MRITWLASAGLKQIEQRDRADLLGLWRTR